MPLLTRMLESPIVTCPTHRCCNVVVGDGSSRCERLRKTEDAHHGNKGACWRMTSRCRLAIRSETSSRVSWCRLFVPVEPLLYSRGGVKSSAFVGISNFHMVKSFLTALSLRLRYFRNAQRLDRRACLNNVGTKQHRSVVDELYTKQSTRPASYFEGGLQQWLDSFIFKVFYLQLSELRSSIFFPSADRRLPNREHFDANLLCALRRCRLCRCDCRVVVIDGIPRCKNELLYLYCAIVALRLGRRREHSKPTITYIYNKQDSQQTEYVY